MQYLSPYDLARVSQLDTSLSIHVLPSAKRTAQLLVPAYRDEISVLRLQLQALTNQNRRLLTEHALVVAQVNHQMMLREQAQDMAHLEQVHLRSQYREALALVESTERNLAWEGRMRRYLESMAERQIPLPPNWVDQLRGRGGYTSRHWQRWLFDAH